MQIIFVVAVIAITLSIASCSDMKTNDVGRGLDAKNILSSIAGSFMSRGYLPTANGNGASQVVSLNLTNLLVLVLLKALIFAAGTLGAGTWKGGYGRSNDNEEPVLTEEELLLMLTYIRGDNNCLKSIACHNPTQAKKYAAAGEMLLKLTKMFYAIPDPNYVNVLNELEEASQTGFSGGDCHQIFKCSGIN